MAELSEIEQYVIDKVREMRNELKISQTELSVKIGVSEKFVGNVESPKRVEKYNLKHLNAIAKVLECSPKDLLPERAL